MDTYDDWPPMGGTQRQRDDRPHLRAELRKSMVARRAQTWRDDAACKGMDPDLFFPQRGESAREAKAVCATCPVIDPCREAGMNERFGVWGSLGERQRIPMRRQRRNAA